MRRCVIRRSSIAGGDETNGVRGKETSASSMLAETRGQVPIEKSDIET